MIEVERGTFNKEFGTELYEALGVLVEASEQYADYLYELADEFSSDSSAKSYEECVSEIDRANMLVRQFLHSDGSIQDK